MPLPRPFSAGLYASGQPSPTDLEMHAAAGVRTVINLRSPTEELGFDEAREVERLGLRYVVFPIAGPRDVTPEAACRFSRVLERAQADGPALLHCASANRVGAMIALERGLVRGSSLDDALSVGRAAGLTSLEPHVAQLIRQLAIH